LWAPGQINSLLLFDLDSDPDGFYGGRLNFTNPLEIQYWSSILFSLTMGLPLGIPFFGAPGEMPLASKTLARFIEQQFLASSGTHKIKKGPRWDPFELLDT
jgi:hypothetical protein